MKIFILICVLSSASVFAQDFSSPTPQERQTNGPHMDHAVMDKLKEYREHPQVQAFIEEKGGDPRQLMKDPGLQEELENLITNIESNKNDCVTCQDTSSEIKIPEAIALKTEIEEIIPDKLQKMIESLTLASDKKASLLHSYNLYLLTGEANQVELTIEERSILKNELEKQQFPANEQEQILSYIKIKDPVEKISESNRDEQQGPQREELADDNRNQPAEKPGPESSRDERQRPQREELADDNRNHPTERSESESNRDEQQRPQGQKTQATYSTGTNQNIGGFNWRQMLSNISLSLGMSGATQSQGMYGATQSQGMYGATQSQGMYGATQSQGMYGATQSQGMYGMPQSQGMDRMNKGFQTMPSGNFNTSY